MLLSLLSPVFESWPCASCFCVFAEELWLQNTTKPPLCAGASDNVQLQAARETQALAQDCLASAVLMWNQMVLQWCFALRFLGLLKSRKLGRRETISGWKHTQLTNRVCTSSPVHSLGRNVTLAFPTGATLGPSTQEPCRERGHADSGRPTNPAPGQMGKKTGTQNRIMLYRRFFFSKINPNNHQLVLISVCRWIDFEQKSSNRCLSAALQEAERQLSTWNSPMGFTARKAVPCQAGPQPESCALPMTTAVALPALGAFLWGITRHGCALGAGIKSALSFHILRTVCKLGKCGGRHKKRAGTDKARLSQVSSGGRTEPVLSSQWSFGNKKQRWSASYRFYLLRSPWFLTT